MQKDKFKKVTCTRCNGLGLAVPLGCSPLLTQPVKCKGCNGKGYVITKSLTVCMNASNGNL